MINLVKNAIKFTPSGKIVIEAAYNWAEKEINVRVSDTGVGISTEDIPKLFTKFGKLIRTSQMNQEGIGLGLSIAKQIIERCNG